MSTNKLSYNTQISIAAPSNDNTLTKILAINNSNNIIYRNSSTVGPNQILNTTSNVTFNSVTTNMITSTATNNVIIFPDIFSRYLYVQGTTTNAIATTIFTYATTNNYNYLVYAEVASKDSVSGGGAYLQTKMISNTAGAINNVITMENLSNRAITINTSSINLTSSGTNIILQITGVSGRTINWKGLIRIINVNFI